MAHSNCFGHNVICNFTTSLDKEDVLNRDFIDKLNQSPAAWLAGPSIFLPVCNLCLQHWSEYHYKKSVLGSVYLDSLDSWKGSTNILENSLISSTPRTSFVSKGIRTIWKSS